jgi:acyl dehydratase
MAEEIAVVRLADEPVGTELFSATVEVERESMVRYAGASGDFNKIHWNERFAREVGLPNVIVHGMLTMGLAATVLEDWLEDPGRVLDYGVRFTRPIPVPDPGTVEITVVGKLAALDAEAGTARIDLTVAADGATVLGKAQALIRT